MSQPAVTQTETDGALGILSSSAGKLLALVGVSSKGPIATPATYGNKKDLVADFGRGPLVEAAAHAIEKYGRPVLVVRAEADTEGAYLDAVSAVPGDIGAITKTGTGSATFADNSSDPAVEADVVVLFNVGGTQGVSGIVYQISLDNGNTWGPPLALGTASHIDIGATGASVSVSGGGTIVAGDFITFHLTAPIEASAGEVVVTGSGSSNSPTLDGSTHPDDDFEVKILFVNGGTRGTPGVTYRWSLDGGRTYSPVTALGSDAFIIVPESGGVKIELEAGTFVAGDTIAFPCVAPKWNTTTLGTALDALKATVIAWELVEVVGPVNASATAAIDTKVESMLASGKFHAFIASTRLPVGDESEATYLASLANEFADAVTVLGEICAGGCRFPSSVSGRFYRRPIALVVAALEASVSEELNIAAVKKVGAIKGVSIRDEDGNPEDHDESAHPGLDDARFTVLRTWEGKQGVYVNRPRIMSAEGSDFDIMPKRRVMNLLRATVRAYLLERMNSDILVDKNTGFILESEALEIEAGAMAALRGVLLAKPKASGVTFVLARNDNLLSTKTLNATARAVPLGYVEFIEVDVGFENPALQVTAV